MRIQQRSRILDRVQAGRRQLEDTLGDSSRRRYFTPSLHTLYEVLLPTLAAHARGDVLDAGCGVMPFRTTLLEQATSYDGLDREPRRADVRYRADLENMEIVPPESYDTVLCSQVLEHVRHPSKALREIHRVLRPGGKLIVTVPHLSALHDEPEDYHRFTEHGLRALLEEERFEPLEIVPAGSIFSLIGHQLGTVLVGVTWPMPTIRNAAFWLNTFLVTLPCAAMDDLVLKVSRLPLNYVAVARRSPVPQR